MVSLFLETVQEKWCGSFSICFPHRSTTAVQTTLVTPVAIRTWTISSIICSMLQVAIDDAASGISFWSLFVWRLPFDLSSKGGPASSYATAGIAALRVPDVLKPRHHDKVEPPHIRLNQKIVFLKRRWDIFNTIQQNSQDSNSLPSSHIHHSTPSTHVITHEGI
jgi:hypothetical protein